MLIVCLVLSAVTSNEFIGSSTDNEKYYSFPLTVYASIWSISVTGIALIFELIYFVLRFLNIRCYNNCYIAYGILVRANSMLSKWLMWRFTQDIIRYILLVICLAIGCAGYALGASYARNSADRCDERVESIGEEDTACGELRERATDYTVVAVSKNFRFISLVYHSHCVNRCYVEWP